MAKFIVLLAVLAISFQALATPSQNRDEDGGPPKPGNQDTNVITVTVVTSNEKSDQPPVNGDNREGASENSESSESSSASDAGTTGESISGSSNSSMESSAETAEESNLGSRCLCSASNAETTE